MRPIHLLLVAAAALVLAGCGNKGPLVMPPPQPAAVVAPKPAPAHATTTAPAPSSSTER